MNIAVNTLELPVLPPGPCAGLVLVVPVHKTFPESVARTVGAVVSALSLHHPVAVVDLQQAPWDALDEGRDWPRLEGAPATDHKALVVRVRVEAELEGPLDLVLAGLAELISACDRLRAAGRAVVLVGPRAAEQDRRFWLYAGLAGHLATHLVLCTDAHFADGHRAQHGHHGHSLAARLRAEGAQWSPTPLAVVVEQPNWHGPEHACATKCEADVLVDAAADARELQASLGCFLGVYDLPEPGAVGPPVRDSVRAVLASRAAPLRHWDWKGPVVDGPLPQVTRYDAFVQLVHRAAELSLQLGPWFRQPDVPPSIAHPLALVLDRVPEELAAVREPVELRGLAVDVLQVGRALLALAAHPTDDRPPLEAEQAVASAVNGALVAVLRLGAVDPGLRHELVRRASLGGPVLELAVFRALHQAGGAADA